MTQKSQGVYQTKNLYSKGNNQNEEPAYKMGKYIFKPCMWYGVSIQKLIQSISSKFNYACKELVFKELIQLNCKKKKKKYLGIKMDKWPEETFFQRHTND